MTSMPYSPAPIPPGVISPSSMLNSGTRPRDRLEAVVPGVDRARARAGRDGREQPARGGPEADVLALHVAERLVDARREQRVAGRLAVHRDEAPDEEDGRHGGEDRPALALIAGHPAEGVGQRERDREHRQHLDQVGERGRVLEGVGRVGVEEAAAVVAQLLDDLLRGDRTDRDRLLAALERRHRGRRSERLGHALPDQDDRDHDRDRQQDVEACRGSGRPRSCRWSSSSAGRGRG